MPPKAKMPAPIDRPLSRAYLRQFSGWSTAYPPGASDPTSMRHMENLLVNRDGSIRIRPGLRMVTRNAAGTAPLPQNLHPIGGFEAFYLNDGTRAYLFAVRSEATNRVEFRVGKTVAGGVWELDTISDHFPTITGFSGGQPFFTNATTYVKYVQIDNKILALSNAGEEYIVFHVGATKKVINYDGINVPSWDLVGGASSAPLIGMPSYNWYISDKTGYPAFGTGYSGSNHLIDQDMNENVYNFAAFYTYSNELGESAPSAIGQRRISRPFGSWLWETSGNPTFGTDVTFPSGTATTVATDASDILALVVPDNAAGGFAAARDAGATKLNFYVACWSIQEVAPVEMFLIGSRDITPTSTRAAHGWFVMNPGHQALGPSMPIPTKENRYNSSVPSKAGQGLVASDRLVLVKDPTAAAMIRWTTNEQGNYLNFAPHLGGGYKTLTSGNMQIPACVKLWQNPQSVDTLTVLCMGTDGQSSAYYMAPATVTSQSDNTMVMGFEETTATPGTTSPYGCEVANNALYHPLDDQLMKSTASNYNINHKSMTDQIADKWRALRNKDKIVSCFFDQRIYYLVDNPEGEALKPGCFGNEVWVLDLSAEGGNWSRWLVQGNSLKKIQMDGQIFLSIIRPDGIYAFDETRYTDELPTPAWGIPEHGGGFTIPWLMETNTQGANRAHDAPTHLQQVNLTLGNFRGSMEIGVRFMDIHGQKVVKKKRVDDIITDYDAEPDDGLPWDQQDFMSIQRDTIEWFFFARNATYPGTDEPISTGGQITLIQYRYTPVTVNVGYEYGNPETLEYGHQTSGALLGQHVTENAVPKPMLDRGRP